MTAQQKLRETAEALKKIRQDARDREAHFKQLEQQTKAKESRK